MADNTRSSDSSDSDSCSDEERVSPAPRLPPQPANNLFKNDGSFLEMFKKMQDKKSQDVCSDVKTEYEDNSTSTCGSVQDSAPGPSESQEQLSAAKKASILSSVRKRRLGRVLPTGTVKKQKKSPEGSQEGEPNDAWSQYLSEVRKYREQSCEEEGKTRPLVK